MVIYISIRIKNFNYLSKYLWCNVKHGHLKFNKNYKLSNIQIYLK